MAMNIGVDGLHIAKLTKDDAAGVTYETVIKMAGVQKITITPNSSVATAFYDNGPGESAASMGAIELGITKAFLLPSEEALLLGKTLNADGVIMSSSSDVPPEVAAGFRVLKSNGKYIYFWLLKGVFSEPESEIETKGEEVNFQGQELKGNFSKLNYESTVAQGKKKQLWCNKLDEEAEGVKPEVVANWFTEPYVEAKAAVLAEPKVGV